MKTANEHRIKETTLEDASLTSAIEEITPISRVDIPIHDSVVDEAGKVHLERKSRMNISLQKQSSFELPSILQSLFSSSSTTTVPKTSNVDNERKPEISKPSLASFLPLRLSQENLSTGYSKLLHSTDQRPRAYSLDKFKLRKSDSTTPLLQQKDNSSNVLEVEGKENVEPKKIEPEKLQPCVLDASSKELKPKVENELQGKSLSQKHECLVCAKEAQKRQKLREEEALAQQIANCRRLAKRRETFRPQGSLDSAQSDRTSSGSIKGWSPSLTRSGSLDLDVGWRDESTTASKTAWGGPGDNSLSTSQDSLQSDTGGAPTLHRYYHVFRDRELDQLIEKYVQNLHIISSYYDHANWCIIAEKVQVWTI